MKIDVQPWEMLSWLREGRIIRGNVVYTKSGTVYTVGLNGKWNKVSDVEAPALVYKFFALSQGLEGKTIDNDS